MSLFEEQSTFDIDKEDVVAVRGVNDTVEQMRKEMTRRSDEMINNRSDGDFLDQAFEENRVRRLSVEEVRHELRGS